VKILVVEDERRVANFICRALRENAYAVDVVNSGERALAVVTEGRYDGILLDVRLPGLSGIAVCREWRAARIETPILMLSARSLVEQRVEGLDAGADDYLTKPFVVAELLARVRALVRRRASKLGRSLHFANVELDRHRRTVSRSGSALTLTAKEFAVLEFLMMRAPEVASRTEIIEHAWDSHFDSETNLVEVYINRLRQKMGEPRLIQTVHGVGYCLRSEE
jgi:two-component system copper resistance phosphate regulon response regulator CusR